MIWLQQQDLSQAEAYWCRLLDGYTAPTHVVHDFHSVGNSLQDGQYEHQELQLNEKTTAALRAVSRRFRVTLNNVAQGAWALLLSRWSGQRDVVFGVTVSGRPADLPGVESIVGMFINNLPMRAHVIPDQPLESWLREFNDQQLEMQRYEYSPLALVQEWSDLPPGAPLFESLLVFQNDTALKKITTDSGSTLEIQHLRSSPSKTGYPLTLMIGVGTRLSAVLTCDSRSFDSAIITKACRSLEDLFEGFAENPSRRLGEFMVLLDDFAAACRLDVEAGAVPASDRRSAQSGGDFARPSTPMQTLVAQVWQEVLNVDQIGLYDNFFDIGGTSQLAMQSVLKLEKNTGLRINPVELMSQTLAQVAAVCERRLDQKEPPSARTSKSKIRGLFKHLALPGGNPDS
jgi:hypothetical protein